jgi:hypothetical protein
MRAHHPTSRTRASARGTRRGWRWASLTGLALTLVLAAACGGGPAGSAPPAPPATPRAAASPTPGQRTFDLPSINGLNYGGPDGADGQWLGSRYLRSGTGTDDGWPLARPRLQADLDFIASHHLGSVQRLFIGLDQLMVWDPTTGFQRFDETSLANLTTALDMFDAHHLKAIVVVFDQEEVSSPGNFHFQALDGGHAAMRANYLAAVDQFFRRFGGRATVVGWDLFNEAYNSLGREGGLRPPPARDPVSPNYSDDTVHGWIRDLYLAAKRAAPAAWMTVSDTTELYWPDQPVTTKYADSVDFYDIHVYDDHPSPRDWKHLLDKPFVLGEVGGDTGHGFKDQSANAKIVAFWLSHARELGIGAVLAQAGTDEIYSLSSGQLTPTGQAVEAAP